MAKYCINRMIKSQKETDKNESQFLQRKNLKEKIISELKIVDSIYFHFLSYFYFIFYLFSYFQTEGQELT